MLSDDQESCMSSNSQDFGQTTSTSISPLAQPPSITAGDISGGQSAINMLIDDVLLEIFAWYVEESQMRDAWHTLACVCRRWRSIAFGSPRRLNLRIFCSYRTPVRKNLNFWPPFPIVLTAECEWDDDKDNIPATLEHHDRVCDIKVWNISCLLWEKALPLLQKPFPILTDLNLRYTFGMEYYVVPDLFLGGSATRLRNLRLEGIPFPGLPKLLFSATHLVHIELYDIPDSGFVAPEAMVTCISTLTRLESLTLWFESPRPHPEWERRRTSSPTCALRLLPSLTCFSFKGVSEYLEDIVDSIDAPQLKRLRIKFFHQPVFDTPRLSQFISRVPKLKTCNEVRMRFDSRSASVKVLSLSKKTTNASLLLEECYYRQFAEFQLSPMVQFCNSSFPQALFPTVEDLIIVGSVFFVPPEEDGIDPSLWRELLQPFTAVKDLYLHPKIASRIALALQDLAGGSVLELFPVMQNIFLKELWPSGLVPEGIEQFVAARQLAGRPISVSCWERKILLTW